MNLTWQEFSQYVGSVVTLTAVGGVIATGFGIMFKKAVEKWIDNHFDKKKKEFEHEQAVELQKLKVKIDTIIQGSLKLQEREFKIIPEALEKVGEAFGLVSWICSPLQYIAQPGNLTDEQLEEALAKIEFAETEKKTIRSLHGQRRNDEWRALERFYKIRKAKKAIGDAERFLKINGIFIPESLKEQLDQIKEISWEVISDFEVATDFEPEERQMLKEARDKLKNEGQPLMAAIEKAVRARLVEQTQLVEEQAALAMTKAS